MKKESGAKAQLSMYIDYKRVFEGDVGQKVLLDMMKAAHMLTSTYTQGCSPHEMAFREGERNTILRILTILKLDIVKLHKIIEQNVQSAGEAYSEDL